MKIERHLGLAPALGLLFALALQAVPATAQRILASTATAQPIEGPTQLPPPRLPTPTIPRPLPAPVPSPPPPGPDVDLDTDFRIPLGFGGNVVEIDKTYYLGPSVSRFRLNFELEPAGELVWGEISVRLLGLDGEVLASFSGLGSGDEVDTGELPGAAVRILVSSDGAPIESNNAIDAMFVVIDRVRAWLGADPADAPPLELTLGQEVLVFWPGGGVYHRFAIDTPRDAATLSLYLSPFETETDGRIDPELRWAGAGYNPRYAYPRAPDRGIYREISPQAGSRLFLHTFMADPGWQGHYLLTVQEVAHVFDTVRMEMDANYGLFLADPPGALSNRVRTEEVPQVEAFLQEEAGYDRRVEELFTLANARALAASEGFLRFGPAVLYHAYDGLRDVDVTFHFGCGRPRAYGHPANVDGDIRLFVNQLDDPVRGSSTFHHEWSHYEYGMHDEYVHATGEEIDLNSVMGYHEHRYASEFCSIGNHVWTPGVGAGSNSAWAFLAQLYGVLPRSSAPHYYPQNQATYMDVLHQLHAMQAFAHIRNANEEEPVRAPEFECPPTTVFQ